MNKPETQEVPENKSPYLKNKLAEKRSQIKFLGLKALKGTVKQKIWAEEIRLKMLNAKENSETRFVLSQKTAGYAKFWIENRNKSLLQITEKLKKIEEIKKQDAALNAEREKILEETLGKILTIEHKNNIAAIIRKRTELEEKLEKIYEA